MNDAGSVGYIGLLVPAGCYDLRYGAVGRAKLQGALAGLRNDRAAIRLDRLHRGVPILDLDAPMMDAGAGAGELRLMHFFIVVNHECDIQSTVGHVA